MNTRFEKTLRQNKKSIKLLTLVALFGLILTELSFIARMNIFPFSQISAFLPSQTHMVVLRANGFEPQKLKIRQGDTVVFKTDRDKPFWPASNLHPTHEIFPEFDPARPIEPSETWLFTFNKAGRYKYHDHIHANFDGVITVSNSDGSTNTVSAATTNCVDLDLSQKQACWDEQLEMVLIEEGLDAAFELFIKLYETEPEVPKACHGWGHILGEAAYELYHEQKDVILRPETAYCGYGFFHGFIEKLIHETGDIYASRDFCDHVREKAGNELSGVYVNCVHGIGHGSAAWLVEEPKYWGKFMEVTGEGLAICDDMYSTHVELENCYDGVFNELSLDLVYSEYGFSLDEFRQLDDPFWYCRRQEERHKESCYFEFIGLFDHDLFNDDIEGATLYAVQEIPNRDHQYRTIAKLAADFMQDDIVNADYKRNVEACRLVPDYLFEHCFGGLMNGFIQHGEPNRQHVPALKLCSSDYVTARERQLCYSAILGWTKHIYDESIWSQVCQSLEATVRQEYCS